MMRAIHDLPGAEDVLRDAITIALSAESHTPILRLGMHEMEVELDNASRYLSISLSTMDSMWAPWTRVFRARDGYVLEYHQGPWQVYLHDSAEHIRRQQESDPVPLFADYTGPLFACCKADSAEA